MHPANCVVALFNTPEQTESVVRKVQSAGVDMHTLSVIGKGFPTGEQAVGFYNGVNRMKAWAGTGVLWGDLWSLLSGAAFFRVPGFGPILVAGPFVNSMLGALEGAALVGGIGALAAALTSVGVPKKGTLRYESALQDEKYVLIASGAPSQVEQSRQIIEQIEDTNFEVYPQVA